MGARRAAACLCTARVLREVVAPGGHPSARAGLCGILVRTSGGGLERWRGEPTVGSSMVGWCSSVAATLCTGLPFPCCALTKYERF